MSTKSSATATEHGAHALARGLLARLGHTGNGDFLPDLPDAQLIGILSRYYRTRTPQKTAAAASPAPSNIPGARIQKSQEKDPRP
ncbi:hypothetical protein [Streptomyces sp. NPDC088785]|uniref:hypothetical protein n=1 Tax=Streptomyces sp. NPDC088785 TaxID=3365897 RepID=UPI00380377C7